MRLGIDLSIAPLSACDIVSQLINNSFHLERQQFEQETSRLSDICPNHFQFERIEYLLGLLGAKQVTMMFYNSTKDLQNALVHSEIDLNIYANLIQEQSIVVPGGENLSFVAPFTQDSICLVQSVNVMMKKIVQFDDKFWISPYSSTCWMFILFLFVFQQIFLITRLRHKNHFYKLVIIHSDAWITVIVAAFAAFMYLPYLRGDATTFVQQYKIPYKTAQSLADAIMRGEARVALVKNSFVFNSLMTTKIDSFNSLDDINGYDYLL